MFHTTNGKSVLKLAEEVTALVDGGGDLGGGVALRICETLWVFVSYMRLYDLRRCHK